MLLIQISSELLFVLLICICKTMNNFILRITNQNYPEFSCILSISLISRTQHDFPECSLISLLVDNLMQHRNSNKLSTLPTLHHATSVQEIVPCALSIRLCQLKHKIAEHCALGWADLELFSKMDLLLMPKVEYPIG